MKNMSSGMPNHGHYTPRKIEMEVNDRDGHVINQNPNRPGSRVGWPMFFRTWGT